MAMTPREFKPFFILARHYTETCNELVELFSATLPRFNVRFWLSHSLVYLFYLLYG